MLDISLEQANEGRFTEQAQYFEYSSAANPIRPSLTPRIPFHLFPSTLYDTGLTRRVTLDLSVELKCPSPATGPGLCASFLRINEAESLSFNENATSQVFYVIPVTAKSKAAPHALTGRRVIFSPRLAARKQPCPRAQTRRFITSTTRRF
jgi:hypothetical protein